jgi:hypothetical protein
MNIKPSHLFGALAVATAFGTFSSAASAASCSDVQNFVAGNRTQIESALLKNYGGDDHQVSLGRNNGHFNVMRVQQTGVITKMSGCTIQYTAHAEKFSPAVDAQPGVNPAEDERHRGGSVVFSIGFDANQGDKLCINSQHISSVNWKGEGKLKERIFLKNNRNRTYFNGCLL